MSSRKVLTDLSAFAFTSEADRDYLAARLLNFAGNPMWKPSAYHCQQALEKYLKALTVQKAGYYLGDTHKLKELASECESLGYDLRLKEGELERFDDLEQVARYGAFAKFDPLSIKNKNLTSKGVFVWTDSNVKDFDSLVFKIRNHIDFSKEPAQDGIGSLFNEKPLPGWLTGWRLPGISMRIVLVSVNDYWKECKPKNNENNRFFQNLLSILKGNF